jgi:hypothetical protein
VAALCSSTTFNFKPEQIGRTELLMSWGEHVASWTPEAIPLLVLRYEDLLANAGRMSAGSPAFSAGSCPTSRSGRRGRTSPEHLRRQEAEHGFNEAVRRGAFSVGKAAMARHQDQSVFELLLDRFARLMRRHGYLEPGDRSTRRAGKPARAAGVMALRAQGRRPLAAGRSPAPRTARQVASAAGGGCGRLTNSRPF